MAINDERSRAEVVLELKGLVRNGELTEEGVAMTRDLLLFVPSLPKIPRDLFLLLMGKNVSVAVEMVLIRDGMVYLAWRKDKFFTGWHVPGTYISPKETTLQSVQRCANREVFGIEITTAEVIGVVNHPDSPRFHDFCALTLCEFHGEINETETGRWFHEWPDDLIEIHRPYKEIIDRHR